MFVMIYFIKDYTTNTLSKNLRVSKSNNILMMRNLACATFLTVEPCEVCESREKDADFITNWQCFMTSLIEKTCNRVWWKFNLAFFMIFAWNKFAWTMFRPFYWPSSPASATHVFQWKFRRRPISPDSLGHVWRHDFPTIPCESSQNGCPFGRVI